MTDWVSAAEIAALQLPGLPGTERNVRAVADREEWEFRKRQGRGGGREYPVSALPKAARAELARRRLAEIRIPTTGTLAERTRQPILDPKARGRADVRLALLDAAREFAEQAGLGRCEGFRLFAAAYNAGRIPVDPVVRAAKPRVAPRSLEYWHAQASREGAARLAGAYKPRNKGAGAISGDRTLADFVTAQLMARPHLKASHVRDAIVARFGRDVPLRTVQRYLTDWRAEHGDELLAIANPDGWKAARRASFGSVSEAVTRLNQIWEIDATPSDVMTTEGRRTLVGLVDVYSRRAMVLVTETPKAVAATSLLRRAILDWGVPETLKTDQGKDFISAHMLRALADLQIAHRPCAPFTPEGKPHIERFFGTLTRGFIALLPGFIGHSVADRKALENRKSFAARLGNAESLIEVSLSPADLQARIDGWLDAVYHHAAHDGLDGRSPFQAAAAWPARVAKPNERALDVLLQEAPGTHGMRRVGKSGIQVDGATFIAPELGELIGARVHVRRDPEDMGRIVVYSADTGRFVCVAECPERTGLDRRAVALAARALQQEQLKALRARERALRRQYTPERLADELVGAGRDRADRLIAFPRPAEPHDTPALREAARAAEPHTIAELTPEQEAAAQAEWDRLTGRSARVVTLPVSQAQTAGQAGAARPVFDDDESMARWILANPDRADAEDRAWLDRKCRSWSFRELIGLNNADPSREDRQAIG